MLLALYVFLHSRKRPAPVRDTFLRFPSMSAHGGFHCITLLLLSLYFYLLVCFVRGWGNEFICHSRWISGSATPKSYWDVPLVLLDFGSHCLGGSRLPHKRLEKTLHNIRDTSNSSSCVLVVSYLNVFSIQFDNFIILETDRLDSKRYWLACPTWSITVPHGGTIWYVPLQRLWFLRYLGLKTGTDSAHFGVESVMVLEGTTGEYQHICRFNSKWVREKR